MKMKLVVSVIVVLILSVGFSGCEEKTDIEKEIIGSWKWVESIVKIDDNTTSFEDAENYTILTFYDNGTAKADLIGSLTRPPYAPHPGDMIWFKYKIENNNQIIYSNFTDNGTDAWNISISEDGKNLSMILEYNNGNFTRQTVIYSKIE